MIKQMSLVVVVEEGFSEDKEEEEVYEEDAGKCEFEGGWWKRMVRMIKEL